MLSLYELIEKELMFSLNGIFFYIGLTWWVPAVVNSYGKRYFSWPFNRAFSRWLPFILSAAYIAILRQFEIARYETFLISAIVVCCYGIIRCDLFFHVIPDRFHMVATFSVFGLLQQSGVQYEQLILRGLFGLVVCMVLIGLNKIYTSIRSNDGMGLGDIKMIFWLSILFFDRVFDIMMYSFMIAILTVVPWYLLRRRAFNEGFAFAPFILVGVLGYLLVGSIHQRLGI